MKWKGSFFLGMVVVLFSCEGNTTINKKAKNNFIIHNESVFQARSLKGDSLFTKIDSVAQKAQIKNLQDAEKAYLNDSNLENLIWIGRREAYLGMYDLAIRTFTKAVSEYPDAFEPLRHRGHRYLSIRKFDEAIEDFEKGSTVNLFPNPVSNYFTLNTAVAKVQIFSVSGQLVKSFASNGNVDFQFSVSELQSGLYVVKASDESGKTQVMKFIKK